MLRNTVHVTSRAAARNVFEGIRYALIDCGGTLWENDRPLPHINEALDFLRHDLNINLRFVTNNATVSREDTLKQKFHKLGLTTVTADEIFSSAYAAQITLRRAGSNPSSPDSRYDQGNVLVLGNEGLVSEIRPALAPGCFVYGPELKEVEEGRTNCAGELLLKQATPYDVKTVGRAWKEPLLPPPQSWRDTHSQRGVSIKELGLTAVVIGLDFKFSPTSLAIAAMVLQQHKHGEPKALFIATNKDPQLPTPGGWMLPSCGSFVASLEVAANRKADVVCGKPTTKMFRIFQEAEEVRTGQKVDPKTCLVIGDRLSTDISFGNSAGARTVHVATGCEQMVDLPEPGTMEESRRLRCIPHYATDSLPFLVDLYRGQTEVSADKVHESYASRSRSVLSEIPGFDMDALRRVTMPRNLCSAERLSLGGL